MLVLFDNGTPRGLARFLIGHSVEEARERGWEQLANGELIDAAEQAEQGLGSGKQRVNPNWPQELTAENLA